MNTTTTEATHRRKLLTVGVLLVAMLGCSTSSALAQSKATKSKKKKATTTRVRAKSAPPKASGARNFSCLGAGSQKLSERMVTGTVTPNITLTQVAVTQTTQLIDNTLVAQPVVVLLSASPVGEPDPGSNLIVFRLNERREATADDVGKLLTLYRFNLLNVLGPGPEFTAGLYFTTLKGAAGPATNEYRWESVPSVVYGGAYSMKCQYV
jgi:hypothetical protein